jgi:hypothetical protein
MWIREDGNGVLGFGREWESSGFGKGIELLGDGSVSWRIGSEI